MPAGLLLTFSHAFWLRNSVKFKSSPRQVILSLVFPITHLAEPRFHLPPLRSSKVLQVPMSGSQHPNKDSIHPPPPRGSEVREDHPERGGQKEAAMENSTSLRYSHGTGDRGSQPDRNPSQPSPCMQNPVTIRNPVWPREQDSWACCCNCQLNV